MSGCPHVSSAIIAERSHSHRARARDTLQCSKHLLLQNVNDIPHRRPRQSQTRSDTAQSIGNFSHQRPDPLLPHLQLPVFRQLALQPLAARPPARCSETAPVDFHKKAKAESGMPTSPSVGALVEQVGFISELISLRP